MLRPAWLRRCAAAFTGGADPGAPQFAPLTADLTGLPPMVVQVGSEEILLDDAVRLAVRPRGGRPVDLRRFDGLWHVAQASAGLVAASTSAMEDLEAALAGRLAARPAVR